MKLFSDIISRVPWIFGTAMFTAEMVGSEPWSLWRFVMGGLSLLCAAAYVWACQEDPDS